MVTPAICGIECAKPKFTPDAASMMLFGPGVNAITQANTVSAMSGSRGMRVTDSQRATDMPNIAANIPKTRSSVAADTVSARRACRATKSIDLT